MLCAALRWPRHRGTMHADRPFSSMGTTCRVVLTGAGAQQAAAACEARVRAAAAALTRFDPHSELSAVNADPRGAVPASGTVRALFRAAIWSGRSTGGLVDPTLVAAIESAGYAQSRSEDLPTALAAALAAAPPRRPAAPRGAAWWAGVEVDDEAGTVIRPPGLELDAGGLAKGLIADLVLWSEGERPQAFVDCGGDVAVGGADSSTRPWEVAVRHPLDGSVAHRFRLARGGVATSGIARRLWLRPDGTPAHHLLDPSTGEPAWTGLLSVSAVGRSAVEAEALAKAAYLSGPAGARRILTERGGVLVREDGEVEVIAPAPTGRQAPGRRWPAAPAAPVAPVEPSPGAGANGPASAGRAERWRRRRA